MLTLHTAKGLEFPVVFLMKTAPSHVRAIESGSTKDMEEERRLAYVDRRAAAQRLSSHARELWVTLCAAAHAVAGSPKRFHSPCRVVAVADLDGRPAARTDGQVEVAQDTAPGATEATRIATTAIRDGRARRCLISDPVPPSPPGARQRMGGPGPWSRQGHSRQSSRPRQSGWQAEGDAAKATLAARTESAATSVSVAEVVA